MVTLTLLLQRDSLDMLAVTILHTHNDATHDEAAQCVPELSQRTDTPTNRSRQQAA